MLNTKKLLSAAGLAAVFMCAPTGVQALGLGSLNVNSNLGENLQLDLDLLSITPAELATMEIGLASRADYAVSGIMYPEIAALLSFDIVENADGNYAVSISTDVPISETFLHLLVSASWSGGKVIREYTALLDPPMYSVETATPVAVPESGDQETPIVSTEMVSDSATASTTQTSTSVTTTPEASSGDLPGTITVQRGDTLSGIVNQLGLPGSVSLYQGLSALLEANPDAFVDGNMNRLRAGAVLRIPAADRFTGVNRQVAVQQFRDQVNDYNQYLTGVGYEPLPVPGETPVAAPDDQEEDTSLPEVAEPEPETSPIEEVTEVVEVTEEQEEEPTAIADTTQAEESPTQEEDTRLVIGQETNEEDLASALEGEQGDEAQVDALKEQLAELDESLLASGVESEEIQRRLAEIQDQVDRVSKLIEVEDTSLAMVQDREATEDNNASASTDSAEATSAESEPQSGENEEQAVAAIDQASQPATDPESTGSEPEEQPESGSVESTAAADTSSTVQTNAATDEQATPASTEEDTAAAQQAVAQVEQQPESSGTTRQVANGGGFMDMLSDFFAPLKGIFVSISDYALKIAAIVIALLAGLFFYRRRKSQQEFEESMLDIESGQVSANTDQRSFMQLSAGSGIELASGGAGNDLDLTVGGGMSFLSENAVNAGVTEEENEVIQSGAVDPMAEADVYLAYDRDEQAIQVLKEAYTTNPERAELAEKLLEIYHKQDDRVAFDNLATALRGRLGAKQNPVWTRVIAMGKEVSPGNDLYDDSFALPDSPEIGSGDDLAGLMDTDNAPLLDTDSGLSDGAAVADIQIGELEMEPAADQEATSESIDAPTLSQIVSSVEAQSLSELEGPDDGSIEFKLGDEANDDMELGEEEASELVEVLSQFSLQSGVEEEVKIIEQDEESSELVDILNQLEAETQESLEAEAELIDDDESSELVDLLVQMDSVQNEALEADTELTGQSEPSVSNLEPYHESETALELAKAYLELGEKDIAKGFIEEVINEGNEKQKEKAEKLVKDLVD